MSALPSILPLRLENVSFQVGDKRLIDSISESFEPGTRTFILGPNGAGKSLLLRLMHGLLPPSSGTVTWMGPRGPNARKRQAMVFQRPVMLRRSAAANIACALSLRGVPRHKRAALVSDALKRTGLADIANRPARVLSGGEQQRLALARAWALEPDVMFLDEPSANLDPASSRSVERVVGAIHDSGTKIIMTTHDLGQTRRLADEVLFMHRGQIIERTPAAEFFEKPRTREADAFVRGELYW